MYLSSYQYIFHATDAVSRKVNLLLKSDFHAHYNRAHVRWEITFYLIKINMFMSLKSGFGSVPEFEAWLYWQGLSRPC